MVSVSAFQNEHIIEVRRLAQSEDESTIAKLLLHHGASAFAEDIWGQCPKYLGAAPKSSLKVASPFKFMPCNTAMNSIESKEELEMKLMHHAASGDLAKMKKLISCNVSVHAVDYNGRTCLHLAAERGHLDIVNYLLDVGAKSDSSDVYGETPCTLAKKYSHSSIYDAMQHATPVSDSRSKGESKVGSTQHAHFALMEAFPRQIVMAKLQGSRIESVSKESASVLFSDIVGFTSISSTMSARKVSDLLNRLFRKLDRLAYLHGVQKIDIIGDAYVAATNFTEDQRDDHAARLARFAVAAVEAAADTRIDEAGGEDGGPARRVQIRVGIHCGPVVGAVVGSQGLKYTLVGDAVGLASRMESTGVAGRVQCSEAFAALVRQQAHELVLQRRLAPRRTQTPTPPTHPRQPFPPATARWFACGRRPFPDRSVPRARPGRADVHGGGRTFWLSSLRRGPPPSGSCPDLRALLRAPPAAARRRRCPARSCSDGSAPSGPQAELPVAADGTPWPAAAARRSSVCPLDGTGRVGRLRPALWMEAGSQIFRL